MNESKKYYNKGVKEFHKGNLEKAIANLDVAISHDLKNADALNLRGMIYYFKGQSKKAVTSWKINVDFNEDEIAKQYIENYRDDEINEFRYSNALDLMRTYKIKAAIENLEAATDSDFNIINVRNALTSCYIKDKNFTLAKKQAEMVLDKDRNNGVAKENLAIIKKQVGLFNFNRKKSMLAVAMMVVLVASGGFIVVNGDINNKLASIKASQAKENIEEKQEIVNENTPEKKEGNTEKQEEKTENKNESKYKASIGELESAMSSYNYAWMAQNLDSIDIEDLSDEDKKLVDEANMLMSDRGISKLYSRGKEKIKIGNYKEASEILISAKNYSCDSYLDQHITYMLAEALEMDGDKNEAITYYEKYLEADYKEEAYKEEVLYKLAMLNSGINNTESKKYANKLVNEHKDSIYNNQNIKRILNN